MTAQRGVAQVVERLLREQEAGGSSPLTPTKKIVDLCRQSFLYYHGD